MIAQPVLHEFPLHTAAVPLPMIYSLVARVFYIVRGVPEVGERR